MTEAFDESDLEPGDELVEIDWDAIQSAVDGFAGAGLDFRNSSSLADHLAALIAALLRRMHEQDGLDEGEMAEAAAEMAAFAVDLAVGGEELPEFVPSDELEEN